MGQVRSSPTWSQPNPIPYLGPDIEPNPIYDRVGLGWVGSMKNISNPADPSGWVEPGVELGWEYMQQTYSSAYLNNKAWLNIIYNFFYTTNTTNKI